jgi:UDPglucose 6-dehydrogenase
VADLLANEGAELSAYDPCVADDLGDITVQDSAVQASRGADILVVLTEWPEFAELDWPELANQVANQVILDTRNVLPADKVTEAGFRLISTGR